MLNIKKRPILILDFGSQYTQLIGRRIREMGVYCEIHPYDADISLIKTLEPCGLIMSGGPATVTSAENPRAPKWVYTLGLPILGICYGMQTMAAQLGGEVRKAEKCEFGNAKLQLNTTCQLFKNIGAPLNKDNLALLDVWMSHGDKVVSLPSEFRVICETTNSSIAGMANESKNYYGLQFHPEVTHTSQGIEILKRFVFDICKAETNWLTRNIIEQSINEVRQKVGKEQVILGLSGGVDSSVVAALLHKAIGKQLICVFVDTGLLRLHEKEQVLAMFARHMGLQVIVVDAQEKFLQVLANESCPEKKRKLIGRTFIEVFDAQAACLPEVKWLAQGTIYPDVIESAATETNKSAVVIKSHHNVGGLPQTLHLNLLEPLRALFKDEVRKLGLALELPNEIIFRHPFPGPGLGVRILGTIQKEYIEILRQADAIFIEELHAENLYEKVSQAFAVFLPIKSVGVKGDERHYDFVICLRAVETIDFMTAEWAKLPWEFLAHVSNRIVNEVPRVSRVTYDISGKPPATIEWE